MGDGRSACCDKNQVMRGPWSSAEDLKLITFIQNYGHDNWRALPKRAGLMRCGKSCRLRWVNYLKPGLKRGNFTKEEVETIVKLQEALGNKWSKIASHLPGRTDNEIKNVWNTHLKKRLVNKKSSGSAPNENKTESSIAPSLISSSSNPIFLNEIPNIVIPTVGNEFDMNVSHVAMIKDLQQDSVKQWSNEFVDISKNPKLSSTSVSSIMSNISNSSHMDAYKVGQQTGSPIRYYGSSHVNKSLQEAYIQNSLVEMPSEADCDFWKMLDNMNMQSNEVQLGQVDASKPSNFGQEGVQDTETGKYLHELVNEFGSDATKEINKDQCVQKNNAAELGMYPHSFDFDVIARPQSDSDIDLGYVQWWSSWPQNPGL
ncbi:hypothetical protein TanjilG_24383 [Lupinus angustifolius]|uniref:Uncharacterized protein n=1 Tax=Lupinus angustifolius TaxID=3871 RepID=A0A1J7H6H4_LUPAN|nr:PREDICTED: transcription repressor MYB6-like [Lupinus angustifolius]OIW08188.1 hypothetical protein TanjilG_24383 [Lupinus angustifolius]